MMTNREDYYTLITGAGAGIGRAMATECAARGMHVLAVSLPNSGLQELKQELEERYGTKVQMVETDLTREGACQDLYDYCIQEDIRVNILINNVGLGSTGAFESFSAAFYETQMKLNVLTTGLLTRLFVPELKKTPSPRVLNVGSMGGFFHIPYKVIYSATKAFVYSFSMALRAELRKDGISVSVLCPAAVDTNERVRAHNQTLSRTAKSSLMKPEDVAKYAVEKMLRGKAVIVPGFTNRVYLRLSNLVPYGIKMRIISSIFSK